MSKKKIIILIVAVYLLAPIWLVYKINSVNSNFVCSIYFGNYKECHISCNGFMCTTKYCPQNQCNSSIIKFYYKLIHGSDL